MSSETTAPAPSLKSVVGNDEQKLYSSLKNFLTLNQDDEDKSTDKTEAISEPSSDPLDLDAMMKEKATLTADVAELQQLVDELEEFQKDQEEKEFEFYQSERGGFSADDEKQDEVKKYMLFDEEEFLRSMEFDEEDDEEEDDEEEEDDDEEEEGKVDDMDDPLRASQQGDSIRANAVLLLERATQMQAQVASLKKSKRNLQMQLVAASRRFSQREIKAMKEGDLKVAKAPTTGGGVDKNPSYDARASGKVYLDLAHYLGLTPTPKETGVEEEIKEDKVKEDTSANKVSEESESKTNDSEEIEALAKEKEKLESEVNELERLVKQVKELPEDEELSDQESESIRANALLLMEQADEIHSEVEALKQSKRNLQMKLVSGSKKFLVKEKKLTELEKQKQQQKTPESIVEETSGALDTSSNKSLAYKSTQSLDNKKSAVADDTQIEANKYKSEGDLDINNIKNSENQARREAWRKGVQRVWGKKAKKKEKKKEAKKTVKIRGSYLI